MLLIQEIPPRECGGLSRRHQRNATGKFGLPLTVGLVVRLVPMGGDDPDEVLALPSDPLETRGPEARDSVYRVSPLTG